MNYFIYGVNTESVKYYNYCNDKSMYSDETCYNLSYFHNDLYNDDLYNDWSNDWSEDSYNEWKKFLYKDWNKDLINIWNKDLYKDLKKDFKKDFKKVWYNIFLLFFVVSTSLTLSTLVVSKYLYKNMVNKFVEKYNANKEYYDYDSYFFECLDEYYDLDDFNDDLDDLHDDYLNLKYIKQTTPKGEVIMNYNHNNSSFDYYSKKSNTIDFQYLDVVSRIYAVKYNCKNLYIDNYDNNEMLNLKQDKSFKQEKSDKSIFYTRSSNNNYNNVAKEYVSNKYKYKGTCEDFYDYCKNNDFMIIKNCLENVKVDNLNDVANATFFLNKINILDNDNDYLDTIDNDTIEVNNNITISFKTFKQMTDK